MKKIFVLMAALFTGIMAMAQNQPAKDITKVLEFKNAEYNMGKIPFGKPLEYEVEIKNISAETVVLEKVEGGCGCTTPKYEAGHKILPGEVYKITLGFNGGNMGPFTKFATLYFKDGMSRQVKFFGEAFQEPAKSSGKP
ncbi:MAG: DUF1573 domain-containing protein [Chitinophagales bacterium]|nr:DUF1573 domain-containing protein [Chitinophagales bacterium]